MYQRVRYPLFVESLTEYRKATPIGVVFRLDCAPFEIEL